MATDNLQHWVSKNEKNVATLWSDPDFVSKVIVQLNKDFAPYSTVNFETEESIPTKNHLIASISDVLQKLERDNVNVLPQLLYTIDIPETIFQQILLSPTPFHTVLAEVILIREAYKVWIRINFS